MTQMITRCPICATSFRISEAQLKTAKGSVRCGSCLQIFKAQDHLVPQKASPKTTVPQKPDATPKPAAPTKSQPQATANAAAPKTPVSSNPFMKTSSGVQAAVNASSATAKSPPSKPAAAAAAKAQPRPAATAAKAKSPTKRHTELSEDELLPSADFGSDYDELHIEKSNITSELGQENMLVFDQSAIDDDASFDGSDDDLLISDEMPLDDDEEIKPTFSSRSLGEDLSESILEIDTTWRPKEKSLFDREAKPLPDDDDENKDNSDESWALSMLDEMDDDDSPSGAFVQPPPPQADDEDDDEDRPRTDYSRAASGTFSILDSDDLDDDLDDELGADLEMRSLEREEKIVALEDDDDDSLFDADNLSTDSSDDQDDDYYYTAEEDRGRLLSRIEPEPVDMGWQSRHRDLRKKLLWGGMVAAGVLVLIVQVAWLQFDSLGRKEPYRGWYSVACAVFGCELPTMTAHERIRAYNLVVRSHPEVSDALMVDTILLNTAPFAQPFPDLVLSFTNINGKVLAARKFSPQEYLAGELAGRTQMPSQQPIHLSLEIVDPGPEAVNYSAYIP